MRKWLKKLFARLLFIALIVGLFTAGVMYLMSRQERPLRPSQGEHPAPAPEPKKEGTGDTLRRRAANYATHCREVEKQDRLKSRDHEGAVVLAPLPDTYKVFCVVDGDTFDIEFTKDGARYRNRVRVLGLNTPETVDRRAGKDVQCFGKEASARAKALLVGATVRLEGDKTQYERDNFQRILAYVYLQSGELYNLKMIAEGFGHEETVGRAYEKQAEFRAAQKRAQDAGAGMWRDQSCALASTRKKRPT